MPHDPRVQNLIENTNRCMISPLYWMEVEHSILFEKLFDLNYKLMGFEPLYKLDNKNTNIWDIPFSILEREKREEDAIAKLLGLGMLIYG